MTRHSFTDNELIVIEAAYGRRRSMGAPEGLAVTTAAVGETLGVSSYPNGGGDKSRRDGRTWIGKALAKIGAPERLVTINSYVDKKGKRVPAYKGPLIRSAGDGYEKDVPYVLAVPEYKYQAWRRQVGLVHDENGERHVTKLTGVSTKDLLRMHRVITAELVMREGA